MSKSIVTIDTPENCVDCDMTTLSGCGIEHPYCAVLNRFLDNPDIVQEDCPLKELPKSRLCNYYDFEHYTSGYDKGWNDCIEQITGENKRANNKGKDKTET